MAHHPIRNGLDIPIAGAASGAPVALPLPGAVCVDPRDVPGFVARLAVREGDVVSAGQPLLYDKFHPDVQLVAPVAGKVTAIRRGERRVVEGVVLAPEGDGVTQHKAWTLAELAGISAADARAQAQKGGAWAFLRSRPFDRLVPADLVPQAVLIAGTETGPLQPGADVLLSADDKDALQAAVYVLKAISAGPVYVTSREGSSHPALQGLQGCEAHTFSGPHPSGDPTVQVNHLCPPSGAGRVVYLRAWDAAVLGRLFLTGRYDGQRTYAVVGAGAKSPRFVRTVQGAPLASAVGATEPGARWISGSVLTGQATTAEGFFGLSTRAVHLLPEHVERKLLGWAAPALGTWSSYRAFLKGLTGASEPVDLRPGLFGGVRTIIPIGAYERVIATPDIEPTFLFKILYAGDLEAGVKYGMLDLSIEEAALCSFVCPGKLDLDIVLRESLTAYMKEAGV